MKGLDKLSDAGVFIPYAKKHLATKRETSKYDTSIKSIWPEPDWKSLTSPPDVLAYQVVLYRGLRSKPRPSGFGISDEEWLKAFEISAEILRPLVMNLRSVEEVDVMTATFYSELGVDFDNREGEGIRDVYPAYALGRGNGRVYKTPFSFTYLQKKQARWLHKYGWPENAKMLHSNIFPIKLKSGDWGVFEIKSNKGYSIFDNHFQSEDEAFSAAMDHIRATQSTKKRSRADTYKPTKPNVPESVRHPDLAPETITVERLMEDFGISGIQFGNSLSNVEKHRWIENIYVSFYLLKEMIKPFNSKWLGLGGIKLAFGARGKSTAVAHYEPSLNVINLTRQNGPGSLAHEWFHALDHRLGKSIDCEFASRLHSNDIYYQSILSKSVGAKKLSSIVNQMYSESSAREDCLVNRAYRLDSQSSAWSKKGYWSSPEELAARGFEAFIQDLWLREGYEGAWLANGTLENDYNRDRHDMHPYPIGIERSRLSKQYSILMGLLFQPKPTN